MPGQVIVVVRSWPRLSQTFIVGEILALERRGLTVTIVSLAHSGERLRQPEVDEVRARVLFLDDRDRRSRVADHAAALVARPARYLGTLLYALTHPRLSAGYSTCSTVRCFDHAIALTRMVDGLGCAGPEQAGSPHLHAHFVHDPALVGMLTNRLTGVPFTATAHARDLYQIPPSSLIARAAHADALVTCCQANAEYIERTVPATACPQVRVIHHGIELERFTPAIPATPATLSTTDPRDRTAGRAVEATLLSVGRLVEKKGFEDLLGACRELADSGHRFTCHIYGDGPLRRRLVEVATSFGLGSQVIFHGERSRDEIARALAVADVFVLTPRVTDDGDRDGIPNVLVEAMACAVPVVTTSAGGVTELVCHGQNGLVAEPGDVPALVSHIRTLLTDPALGCRLGAEGRRTVEADYDVNAAALALEELFFPQTPIGMELLG